jgi:penicillin-binding protein 2
MPADNPRYAYVALYEGKPHQRISGGHMAAMVVKSFFEGIRPSMEEELIGPTRKANVTEGMEAEEEVAEPVDPEAEAAAAAAAQRAAEEETRQREAEKRHSQTGWDDGRSRN